MIDETSAKKDSVVIEIVEEKQTVPNISHKSVFVSDSNLVFEETNEPFNSTAPVGTQDHQSQNVGSQPTYNTSSMAKYSAYLVQMLNSDSDDNFRGDFTFTESFSEKKIRAKFVKRVNSILSVQLIFTSAFICICLFNETVGAYVKQDVIGVIFCTLLIISILLLLCFQNIRRQYPLNFIVLAIFTGTGAYLTGWISLFYSTKVVMLSMCITSIICISISITACQTKFDLTQCAPFMCFATSIAIIVITLIMILQSFLRLTGISIIIAGILGLLYCMYFMFDIQMIMGGRRIELSPEEYILAALTLYIDVIQILWAVIRILGTCK